MISMINDTISTQVYTRREESNARLLTHKRDMAIPGVEHHFLEALVLGKFVPEHHFHL